MTIRDVRNDLALGLLVVQRGLLTPAQVLSAARSASLANEPLMHTLLGRAGTSAEVRSLLRQLGEELTTCDARPSVTGFAAELHTALSESGRQGLETRLPPENFDTVLAPSSPGPDLSQTAAPFDTRAGGDAAPVDPLATWVEPPAAEDAEFATSPVPSTGGSGADAVAGGSSGHDRFRILRPHARGGLGQVSVAVDEELRREVALKEIQPQFADDLDGRARFVREAEITGHLEHPGVVPVYGLGLTVDGRPYYAMRFIHGRSLKEALDDWHGDSEARMNGSASGKALSLRELLTRFIAVCQTMEYAHSKEIIHRDLKPANIMLGPYGETLVVDWGLAKYLSQSDDLPGGGEHNAPSNQGGSGSPGVEDPRTLDGSALGTPQYMSAEQAAGRWGDVGPRSDVYSLGATLYHVLTGSPPFTGRTLVEILRRVKQGEFPRPRSIRSCVPRALEEICLKAMALRPEDRYASAGALGSDLEHWLADEPVTAHRENPLERCFRWFRRHRAWTQGVATMLPLLLIVATAAFFVTDHARRKEVDARNTAEIERAKSDQAKEEESRQRKLAVASEQRAIVEERHAQTAAEEARRSLANLLLANGQHLQDANDPSGAALWFSRALPLLADQPEPADTLHRIRLGMLLRQLPRPAQLWTIPAAQRKQMVQQTISPDGRSVVMIGGADYAMGIDVATGRELWPPLRHTSLVITTAFSNDGRRIATVSQNRQVRVWDAATGQPLSPPLITESDLVFSALGPDSRAELSRDGASLLVTTTPDNDRRNVEVWDITSARRRFPPLEFKGKLSAVRFTPDGRRVFVTQASAGKFYSTATGEPMGKELVVPNAWSSRYSLDGKWLATTSGDGQATLWDAKTDETVANLISRDGVVFDATFSPDSKFLVTLHSNRAARLWEIPSGKPVDAALEHSERPIVTVFRPDGEQVLTIGLDDSVRIWETKSGRLIAGPIWQSGFPAATFIDGRVWIIANGRGVAWDVSRSVDPGALRVASSVPFEQVEFSPSGAFVAGGAGDRVWLLDPVDGTPKGNPLEHGSRITVLSVGAAGERLVTAGVDGSAQQWLAAGGTRIGERLLHAGPITQVRFDRTGKRLLTCSYDKTARIWDTSTSRQIGQTLEHNDVVRDGDFSSDGRFVVTGGNDRRFRIWDASTGQPLTEPLPLREEPGQSVSQVQFHPQKAAVMAAGESGQMVIREPILKDARTDHFQADGPILAADFSPDGRLVLAAGLANFVNVWDLVDQKKPVTKLQAGFMAMQARFHPSSALLATGSFNGVRLWEADSGRPLGPSLWNGDFQSRGTKALAFSEDGQWLATVDTKLRLWDVSGEKRSPQTVEQLVELIAARRVDERGEIQSLSPEQFEAAFLKVSREWPAETRSAPGISVSLPAAAQTVEP